MPDRIRVLLADESQAARLLIGALLRDDPRFQVVAEVATGSEAVTRREEADVLVTDLVLEDTDAFSVITTLRDAGSELPVVILAAVDPPYLRSEAAARGAAEFFTHATASGELLDGLAAAAAPKAAER